MKIQDLAIIFVIIILPISLVISAYTQYQIKTVSTQTLYDAKLTSATYDAIKAYQLNAQNSSTSDQANSKIRDIEASVETFKNSIMATFRLDGYSEDDLNQYIPALVYTMYDGFYIYSPFENVNYQYDESGTETQENGEDIYGLKPYINYSCRYKTESVDVVITYALDNHVSIQGMINGEYVNESGYLIDNIGEPTDTINYNGIEIGTEELKEYMILEEAETDTIPDAYSYVKINGRKYYRADLVKNVSDESGDGYDSIIYINNGTINIQCKWTVAGADGLTGTQGAKNVEYSKYCRLIENNTQAMEYYKKAKKFTDWLKNSVLKDLKYKDAYEIDGTTQIWRGNETTIFQDDTIPIENELSNFNQHRLAVIRHTIEKNLSNAIANYNTFSGATNDFQMPELKEDEWDNIIHNISMISFLQGLNIGGKVYNGYTIVTNSESEEVVLEPHIYILGAGKEYHKIGEVNDDGENSIAVDRSSIYGNAQSVGRLNLDFIKKFIMKNSNLEWYYYPLQAYTASYKSIIMQDKVIPYEDIYAYVNGTGDTDLAKAFYTALGRERESKYDITRKWNINEMVPDVNEGASTYTITFNANGGRFSDGLGTMIQNINTGENITNIIPIRTGGAYWEEYEFVGWCINPYADPNKIDFEDGVYNPGDIFNEGSDITLYAIWLNEGY